MKKRYLKLVRKTYRYLRSPKLRNYPWLQKLIAPVFQRIYWNPSRSTVASGVSIGLFCSMLPIPLQTLLAALACIRFKANIPLAIAFCWVSNPITQVPIMLFQEKAGDLIKSVVGFHAPSPLEALTKVEFQILETTFNASSFIVGFLFTAIAVSLLGYPLCRLICSRIIKDEKTKP